jgi:uncharacterized protein
MAARLPPWPHVVRTIIMFTRARILLVLAGLVATVSLSVWWYLRPTSFDTRYSGAYRLEDGRVLVVTPRDDKNLRYRMLDGESQALWPVGGHSYTAGPGWASPSPITLRITFVTDDAGKPQSLLWQPQGGAGQHAARLPLPETDFVLQSGDLKLRARLVEPMGPGPFPAVVIAQGSEEDSAIDSYYQPYLFAANGIATLVYDKRGTGGSQGIYTENFRLLARDAEAAVRWLRERKDIDPSHIHMSGYSQGGWIAPLAAAEGGGVRSLLINFGTTVRVIDEDRWGYIFSLHQQGYGDDAIRQVDEMSKDVAAMLDRGEDDWGQLVPQLDAAKRQPWYGALQKSDSALGFITSSHAPHWALHLYSLWLLRRDPAGPYIERLYDPMPALEKLSTTPSLWILAGQDHAIPTEWTLADLKRLKDEGRPVQVHVYQDADHGIMQVRRGKDGSETTLGIEPGYLLEQVNWLRQQSGLPMIPPAS